eukprot:TRINITY_DN4689_c0_g1_i1.p1 TRINITY_DN4689_c0_g1~~TRINITY_DN4689_c0_g1_i1.p1  ORF type:complete len:464 (-),score=70.72 TRINITY_DN4689_c0_g1_i1:147-1538(-)
MNLIEANQNTLQNSSSSLDASADKKNPINLYSFIFKLVKTVQFAQKRQKETLFKFFAWVKEKKVQQRIGINQLNKLSIQLQQNKLEKSFDCIKQFSYYEILRRHKITQNQLRFWQSLIKSNPKIIMTQFESETIYEQYQKYFSVQELGDSIKPLNPKDYKHVMSINQGLQKLHGSMTKHVLQSELFYFITLKKLMFVDKDQLRLEKFAYNVMNWLRKIINRKARLPFNFLHIHKVGTLLKLQQQETLNTHRSSQILAEALTLTELPVLGTDKFTSDSQDQVQLSKFQFFQNRQQELIQQDQISNETNLLKQQLYKQMNLRKSQKFLQTPINFKEKDMTPTSKRRENSSISKQQRLENIVKGIKRLEQVTKISSNGQSNYNFMNKIDVYIKYEHSLQKILRVLKNYCKNLLYTAMVKIISLSRNKRERKNKIVNMGTVLKSKLKVRQNRLQQIRNEKQKNQLEN